MVMPMTANSSEAHGEAAEPIEGIPFLDHWLPHAEKKEVVYVGGPAGQLADNIVGAIRKRNHRPMFFQSSGGLTVVDRLGGMVQRVRPNQAELTYRLERWIQFCVGPGKRAKSVPAAPLKILAGRGNWGLPGLEKVVRTPKFQRDGTLITQPGYCEAISAWLDTDSLQGLSDQKTPTPAQVRLALEIWDCLLSFFPFADAHSKAYTLLAATLPLVEELVEGYFPVHVVSADEEGVGRAALVDCLSFVLTGAFPASLPEPKNAKDWGKSCLELWSHTPEVVVVHDAKGDIEKVVPEILSPRAHQDGRMSAFPTDRKAHGYRPLIFVTTTNPESRAKHAANFVHIRLSPEVANGMALDWKSQAQAFAAANRQRLIDGLVTIVRHFLGSKDGFPTIGNITSRFKGYNLVAGGILASCGMPQLLAQPFDFSANDETDKSWQTFLDAWAKAKFEPESAGLGTMESYFPLYDEISADDLEQWAWSKRVLPTAIAKHKDRDTRVAQLGKRLSRVAKRRESFGALEVHLGNKDAHDHRQHYRIVRVDDQGVTMAQYAKRGLAEHFANAVDMGSEAAGQGAKVAKAAKGESGSGSYSGPLVPTASRQSSIASEDLLAELMAPLG
jgi:hypothetical protein